MAWGVYDYPEPKVESSTPRCPVCGDECEKYFVQDGEIIGCENCVQWVYADEMDEG